jgi:hypothetical protein
VLLPGIIIGYGLTTALAMSTTAFFCEGEQGDSSGNLFDQVLGIATFTSCDGTPAWFSYAMFAVFVLPWFVAGFSLLAPLFSNAVTGTIVGILVLTGAAVAMVNFLF